MITVLLVEDDVRLADALAGALEGHGYAVEQARTAEAALAAPPVDVVLLDLGLPDMDGVELCRRLRGRPDGGETAVIMVTARGDRHDRVRGLRSGADDYVVKPLALEELCARMEAVLRRTNRRAGSALTAGAVTVDPARRTAVCAGVPLDLTRKEFDLLTVLVREAGTVVPREQLLLRVWQTAWQGTRRTLEVHVGTLRSKLGVPGMIETVRGVGYRLVPDARPVEADHPAPPARGAAAEPSAAVSAAAPTARP